MNEVDPGEAESRDPASTTMRILQVVGDTDATDSALGALDLHAAWVGRSLEVRTFAIAPGRRRGLEEAIPVLAPGRRSITAHTQLRREARWADVVVLHGTPAALVAALATPRDSAALVFAVDPSIEQPSDRPLPSRLVRLGARLAGVVNTDPTAAKAVASRLGTSAPVVTIPTGVDLVRAPVGRDERRAARAALGLADTTRPIVRSIGAEEPTTLRSAVEGLGGHWIDGRVDPDLARAAADVVAAPTAGPTGPPRALLLAAHAGSAVVAPDVGALADLVDSGTGAPCGPDEPSIRSALS
ncbi:MAG: hypothetical protein ACHQDC_03605 [Acidimicrobiales bacterium]